MKTTIIGYLLAGGYVLVSILQQGHSIEDWKTWIIPVLLAILGHATPSKQDVQTAIENKESEPPKATIVDETKL